MATCIVSGPWDMVSNGNLTRQQFYRSFLQTLCEALEAAGETPMSNCATSGVWSLLSGDRYITEQEFMSQALNTLCALKDAIAAGGGGGGGGGVLFTPGSGDPPEDGTILTQGYKDTSAEIKWINTNWPSTASPTWEQI